MPELWCVMPAAGIGSRMQADRPKQYLPLAGKTVIEHSLTPFLTNADISGVVISIAAHDPHWKTPQANKPVIIADGGTERADSVLNALEHLITLDNATDIWVLVHDAARPCFSSAELATLCQKIQQNELDEQGGIVAAPVADTLKKSTGENTIDETVCREQLWRAFTPQAFPLLVLYKALKNALTTGQSITDEASAVELAGYKPKLITGSTTNIKITHPQDLALAELYLRAEQ